jgi:3-mercaptopyruvate sulfurtransferase SseA
MQRRHFIVATLAAIALFACSKANHEPTTAELKSLSVDEVAAKLAANDGKTFMFDANTKDSWIKGHVPGAKWIDDENVTADQLPADRNALLVFYCHDEA